MLWWTMSAVATSSSARRRPSGCLRSRAMSRFPRWQPMNDPMTLDLMPSPRVGSTLMTSAPRSASSIGPNGPARYWPKSRTRMPSNGPGNSDHPAGSEGGDLRLAATEGGENFLGVGSGRGLRALHRARGALEEEGDADLGGGTDLGVVHLHHGPRGPKLGMVETLVGGDDRLGGVAGGVELGQESGPIAALV